MLVIDTVNKKELDLTKEELINLVQNENKQVDLFFSNMKKDDDGYLSWNQENWVSVDGKRFVCSYFRDGKALSDYSGYNVHDVKNYFFPEKAEKVHLG